MKRIAHAALLSLAVASAVHAGEVDVSIRYFDKRVYYAGEGTGPVLVQVTVANKGPSTYRFKLADERAFSVDFELRTMTNRVVDPTEILTRKRTQDQPVFFREVSIESGESISFTEDLRDYARLDESGTYVVQARLFPDAESEEGRKRMLDRYRSDLRASIADGDISTIPVDFVIERTSYGAEEGTVVVAEKFGYDRLVERKRYTYYLRRRDEVWTVYDYSVVNLGTE